MHTDFTKLRPPFVSTMLPQAARQEPPPPTPLSQKHAHSPKGATLPQNIGAGNDHAYISGQAFMAEF